MKNSNLIASINGYNIINDPHKKYIRVDPTPTYDELKKLYEIEYYENEKKEYIDNTVIDLEWWHTIYKDKYETFEPHSLNSKKRLLDIGCGSGYFLKYGRERGWNCQGVEPSAKAAVHAQNNGLNVINDTFKRELFVDSEFDVIHLNQVLEHIANPEELLDDIHGLAAKDSLLCISVPNEFSPFQNILYEHLNFKAWWLAPPHHLNYFSVDSLRNFIETNGYKVILEESTFPMELFLLMGDNYIEQPELGRELHDKRKQFDISLSKYNNEFKRALYQSLAKLNIGRTIIMYARKVEK
jgi:2-polyprenyl-3-methyl-5-hydroxy-6-metoxy-1,4-benzoquinol methylase